MNKSLIFIVGPTAIGKSSVALKLAKSIKGEIINADSMQVYSELNIITARPSKTDTKKIPHHLYGYISGSYRYNVAKWCKDILTTINENNKRDVYSIIVGGTGMYIEKFLNGLANIPKISEDLKIHSEEHLHKIGLKKFYEEVYKIDKKSCEKISDKDVQRLKRIWEVFYATNIPLSEWIENNHSTYLLEKKYKIFLYTPDREKVYERANNRFKKMIGEGAIDEVKQLLKLKLDPSLPILRAHGVPEISNYLSGKSNLEQCIEKTQQITRNYVKRQLTWWRSSKLEINNVFRDFPENINIKNLNF